MNTWITNEFIEVKQQDFYYSPFKHDLMFQLFRDHVEALLFEGFIVQGPLRQEAYFSPVYFSLQPKVTFWPLKKRGLWSLQALSQADYCGSKMALQHESIFANTNEQKTSLIQLFLMAAFLSVHFFSVLFLLLFFFAFVMLRKETAAETPPPKHIC